MKAKLLLSLISVVFLSACELYMAPSDFWGRMFKTQSDSGYYQNKVRNLVAKISARIEDYEINKIGVIDLVDEDGRVPILGDYLAARLVEEIAGKKSFRVAQKGEVREALEKLDLHPTLFYTKDEMRKIGGAIKAQAILNGKIVDLGTNLDVQLTLVDIATGEVISSATEPLNRTKFAVEMLRHY